MAPRRFRFRYPGPPGAIAALVTAGLLVTAVPLAAQNAAALFGKAQARQQAVSANETATAVELRAAARLFEDLVRRYPSSGYADDSLWSAADLLEIAYKRFSATADRDKAIRLLTWLREEYPASSKRRQIAARIAALETSVPKPAPAVDSSQVGAPSATAVAPAPAATPPSTAPATETRAGAATVRGISLTQLPRGDRITIEFNQEVEFKSDRVQNPDRVFFDFPNASAATALADRAREINSPLVKNVRIGRPTAGVTRVVLELAGTPRYSAFPLYGPYRVVIDLESSTSDAPSTSSPPAAATVGPAASSSGAGAPASSVERAPAPAPPPAPTVVTPPVHTVVPPPEPPVKPVEPPFAAPPLTTSPGLPSITSRGDYSLARQLGLGISRIVIDAGHGGHDPGAQANGINESELVLDIALRLEKLLSERPGVDVVLTRKTDEFIPLEERTAIANREGADLFLSIHANASRQAAVAGIETYILNFATNPAAEAVAARENATSGQTMGTLPAILKAIALNNKLAESRELATILQTSLVRKLRGQNKGMRDLGVKQAPFVVLIGAQMPSVLAEIAFITNKPEASLLKTSGYRQQIAQALCDAIVKYQAALKKITTVAGNRPAPAAGRQPQ